MEEENSKELQDYWIAIKRHMTGIIFIVLSITIISLVIASVLPSKYRSDATILIEQQEIPPDLVRSTVTSYAAQSIQIIQARVMSRSRLLEIINKFELYKDDLKLKTTEEVIEMMREDVGLELRSADVIDPRTGRPSVATIAFSLSYTTGAPLKAQQVTNELVSLYLKQNLSTRTQKAEDTSKYFKDEIRRIEVRIATLEEQLAEFKKQNVELMPGTASVNMQKLQRKENELSQLKNRLFSLQEQKYYLSNLLLQLSPDNPAAGDSPRYRLEQLETTRTALIARYSPEHPDVIAVERQIEALREQVGSVDNRTGVARQLKDLRAERTTLRQNYSAEHPDVKVLDGRIASLEAELKKMPAHPEQDVIAEDPDNPVYLSTRSQLANVEIEIRTIEQNMKQLQQELDEIESSLLLAPNVEREYNALQREYNYAMSEYQNVKAKQIQADAAMQLESENKGERFTLIEPAQVPQKPISPNRPAIVFIGVFIAAIAGLGYALLVDSMTGVLHGGRQVAATVGIAPLAIIPYQMNFEDELRKKRYRKRTAALAAGIVVAAILFMHFVVTPLDVLWYKALRNFEILLS